VVKTVDQAAYHILQPLGLEGLVPVIAAQREDVVDQKAGLSEGTIARFYEYLTIP